jgi:alanine racemase
MESLTWVEISKKSFNHNISIIKSITSSDIMYIIKANAYGHGTLGIIKLLIENNVSIIGIQSIYESKLVRETGFKGRLILIGPFVENHIKFILLYQIEVTIFEIKKLVDLDSLARKSEKQIVFHLKIETGLHRQGLDEKDIPEFCKMFKKTSHLKWKAISTHFANIENTKDYSFSMNQFQKLLNAQKIVTNNIGTRPQIHVANSGAILMYPEFHGDMVRAGIIVYGMYPSPIIKDFCKNKSKSLEPILSWKTKIMHVHNMLAGETLGYGRTFLAQKDTKIALLPVGYYDGYHRNMRDGYVSIRGLLCPLVGTICMNLMMCNVSRLDVVEVGDEVVLIDEYLCPAENLANQGKSINYEITTMINDRIPRILVE